MDHDLITEIIGPWVLGISIWTASATHTLKSVLSLGTFVHGQEAF